MPPKQGYEPVKSANTVIVNRAQPGVVRAVHASGPKKGRTNLQKSGMINSRNAKK